MGRPHPHGPDQPRQQSLTNFEQQHEENGRTDSLQQHKPHQNLRIRPPHVVPDMIVQRVSDIFKNRNLKETQQDDFDHARRTIDQNHEGLQLLHE